MTEAIISRLYEMYQTGSIADEPTILMSGITAHDVAALQKFVKTHDLPGGAGVIDFKPHKLRNMIFLGTGPDERAKFRTAVEEVAKPPEQLQMSHKPLTNKEVANPPAQVKNPDKPRIEIIKRDYTPEEMRAKMLTRQILDKHVEDIEFDADLTHVILGEREPFEGDKTPLATHLFDICNHTNRERKKTGEPEMICRYREALEGSYIEVINPPHMLEEIFLEIINKAESQDMSGHLLLQRSYRYPIR